MGDMRSVCLCDVAGHGDKSTQPSDLEIPEVSAWVMPALALAETANVISREWKVGVINQQ